MIRLLIFLLAAGFGDTHNPSNASLPIWLLKVGTVFLSSLWVLPLPLFSAQILA